MNPEGAKGIRLAETGAADPPPEFKLDADSQLPGPNQAATVYFSRGRVGPQRLGEQIAAATDSVHMAMYLLNDSSMRAVLAEKARSGTAAVRLIVDSGMLEGSLRPVLQELAAAGVEIVWWGEDRQSMHMKTIVIDGRYVWTGSANWTPSAFDRNVEDMLCVDAPALAKTYSACLDSLCAECREFQPAGQAIADPDSGSDTLCAMASWSGCRPPAPGRIGALPSPRPSGRPLM